MCVYVCVRELVVKNEYGIECMCTCRVGIGCDLRGEGS